MLFLKEKMQRKKEKVECIVSFLVAKKENWGVSYKVYFVIFVQIFKNLLSIARNMR